MSKASSPPTGSIISHRHRTVRPSSNNILTTCSHHHFSTEKRATVLTTTATKALQSASTHARRIIHRIIRLHTTVIQLPVQQLLS
jgi:hypothetical protein